MKRFEILAREWQTEYKALLDLPFFRQLQERTFTKEQYAGLLRETYHNVAHNTKKMSLFQAHVRTDNPTLESRFRKHAAMEIGHDILALDDLRHLGFDADAVRREYPMPSTEALTGFIVFQIQHRNPYAYLGYLYHLEALPTTAGEMVMGALAHAGVPRQAMTFLQEHAEADTVHMNWNREYIENFVRDDADFEAVLYGMRGSCRLHGRMLQEAVDSVRAAEPVAAVP